MTNEATEDKTNTDVAGQVDPLVRPDCNHEFVKIPGIKCSKNKGHSGGHHFYQDVSSSDKDAEYVVHVWNDDGETPVPQEEYGVGFQCNYDDGHDERQKIMNLAIFDAKKTLPKGTVFEVRAKVIPRDCVLDFRRIKKTREEMARDWGICWYYVPPVDQPKGLEECFDRPETATEPLFHNDVDDGELCELGGYILLARIKA